MHGRLVRGQPPGAHRRPGLQALATAIRSAVKGAETQGVEGGPSLPLPAATLNVA